MSPAPQVPGFFHLNTPTGLTLHKSSTKCLFWNIFHVSLNTTFCEHKMHRAPATYMYSIFYGNYSKSPQRPPAAPETAAWVNSRHVMVFDNTSDSACSQSS